MASSSHSNSGKTDEASIDKVLTDMGPRSRFQIVLVLSTFLCVFSTAYHFMVSYFTADDPPWKCVASNSSHFCSLHSNVSIHSSSKLFEERCKLKRSDWVYTSSHDYSLITEFDLVCGKSSVAAFASSAVYMGGILGSLLSGTFADRYGRKPIIVISLFVTTCCSTGCTFVSNIWQFAGLNIVLGAAIVAAYFTTIVYLSEFSPPRYRTLLCNIILFAATTSFFVMDAVAYFIRRWGSLVRCMSISTLIAFILSLFLPESPRWLVVMGKTQAAHNIFERIRKFNGTKSSELNLKSVVTRHERKHTYLDLFRRKEVAMLTLFLGVLWTVVPIVEYSIALESSNLGGNMYHAFALSTLTDLPAVIICTYICDRFGRKKSILGGLFLSGILVACVIVVPRSATHQYTINITLMSLARFVNVTAFFGLYTWSFELYPTVLRSQGMSVCAVFERVGLFAVPFITKVLQKVNYVFPFILISALAVVGTCIGLKLPETNKLATRETYDDFFEKKDETETTFSDGIDNSLGTVIIKDENK